MIDSGLTAAMSLQMTGDLGARLVNMVYMHPRRQGLKLMYYMTKNEGKVVFPTPAERGVEMRLPQLCWELGQADTSKRETPGTAGCHGRTGSRAGRGRGLDGRGIT